MKTAKEWADEFREVAKDRPSAMGMTLECVIHDAMTDATISERYRCAGIAEGWPSTFDGAVSPQGRYAAENIAAAIRTDT